MTCKLLLSCCLMCLAYLKVTAQKIEVTRDFGTWVGIELQKKIAKNFEYSFTAQVRTKHNSTRLENIIGQTGVEYTINKNFSIGGYTRYAYENKSIVDRQHNLRYHIDCKFQISPLQRFKLAYRMRYQQKFINAIGSGSSTPFANTASYIRHRIKSTWKWHKKHKAHIGVECFIRMNEINRYPYFKKMRFVLGDEIKTKIGRFDVGVGYEHNLQPNDKFSFFFCRLVYQFKL